MQIVQLVAYCPPHIGDMEKYAKEASDGLEQKGHQVGVPTSDVSFEEGGDSSTVNLSIHRLNSWELAHTPNNSVSSFPGYSPRTAARRRSAQEQVRSLLNLLQS